MYRRRVCVTVVKDNMWYYKINEYEDYAELVECYPDLAKNLLKEDGSKFLDSPDGETEPLLIGEDKREIQKMLLQMLTDTL